MTSACPVSNSPSIYGWYRLAPGPPSEWPPKFEDNPEASAQTMHQRLSEASGCRASANFAEIAGGGFATIIGEPHWQSPDLQEIARNQCHAVALAHSYAIEGEECLKSVRGGFAAAIVDPSTKTLLLAVDRLGRYPLYYASDGDSVLFGTNLGALLTLQQKNPGINETGLYNYVYFHMVPSPLSIYKGIKKLTPGTSLLAEGGKVSVNTFWSPCFSTAASQDFSEAGKTLRRILRQSVERAIGEDDSAIGAFLSGGLDSSTVAGMLAEVGSGQAQAYAIGFSAEGYDEIPYARITARHFGIKLHEYYVTPDDIVEALPEIAGSYDEPFGNSSALPAYFCANRAAQDGIQRLLAGDGGDELFAGNERYAKQGVFNAYSTVPKALRSILIEPLFRFLPGELPLVSKARSYIAQANTPLPDRLQSYNFLHRLQAVDIFSEDVLSGMDCDLSLKMQRERYLEPQNTSTLNRMLFLDWKFTLADNDLRKVNQMCALAGVDVAYPMLDDDLLDFSCTIPDAWKMKRGKLRHFYKEALAGWLPEETIDKKKHGFGLPFGVWMQDHKRLQSLAYDSLLSLKNRRYFKPAFIDDTIKLHRSGHAAYYGELIWVLMVLELWLQRHTPDG